LDLFSRRPDNDSELKHVAYVFFVLFYVFFVLFYVFFVLFYVFFVSFYVFFFFFYVFFYSMYFLCCSMYFLCCYTYCLFCDVLCIVCVYSYVCTELLPPDGYPIAVKYIICRCIINGCVRLEFVYCINSFKFLSARDPKLFT
jgi:hypothetical protein